MNSNENQKDFSRDSVKYDERDSINSKDFMIGALIGGIVGAATALFLAPKSGKELRSDLNESAKYLSEKTDHLRHSATEKTEKLRQTAMEKGAEFAEVAKVKTGTLSDAVTKQSANIIENVKNATAKKEVSNDEVVSNEGKGKKDTPSLEKVNQDQAKLKLEETEKAFSETENRLKL